MSAADRHARAPTSSAPLKAGEAKATSASKAETALFERLAPLVSDLGFDLEEVRVSRVGRRTLVKVVVDADGGLELDDIADVSRAVDAHLDADDPFSGPFVLEVSSPGVDRPLTEPRHWRRNIHRLVQVDRSGAAVTARIVAADDDGVTLRVDGGRVASATTIQAPYSDLGPGRVQVEFNRPAADPAADDDAQEG